MKRADFFPDPTILWSRLSEGVPESNGADLKNGFSRRWRQLGCWLIFLVCGQPALAWAHGERPQVVGVVTGDTDGDAVWVLTDNQGLFAEIKGDFRWLCEDAVSPGAGIRGLAVYGALHQRMVVATTAGLFVSEDGGCEWERGAGPVGAQRLIGLWSGASLDDLVVASDHHRAANDVFTSRDGGRTWSAAGLNLPTPIHQLLRAHSAPNTLYIQSAGQVWVSRDGGDNFGPSPPLQGPARLLAVSPVDPNIVFAATEAIPETTIWRSVDGGSSWAAVLDLADLDLRMAIHPNGDDLLLVGRLVGTWASTDGGQNWRDGPPLPPAVTFFEARPDGHLVLATDVYSGGPWVLGRSTDWGDTWQPVLTQFWDVTGRWDCGPLTRGYACCRGLCPGRPAGADCGQTSPPAPVNQCVQPPGVDLGLPPDAGPDDPAQLDADLETDTGFMMFDAQENESSEANPSSSNGCQQSDRDPSPWVVLGWMLLFCRIRTPRSNRVADNGP